MTKQQTKSILKSPDGKSYLVPFILISSLFLLWGFAHSLLDVLNAHFQKILHVSKAQSGFVQFSLYIGYFVMAVPAGLIMKKYGYKKGIVFGLWLFAAGAFLFYPAALIGSFVPFLIALFVIASGLACLETAANPYSTVLGPSESAPQRINLSQSFNGLGWILGPLVGGLLIFGGESTTESTKFNSLLLPYMLIGIVVLVVSVIFMLTPLPEIKEESDNNQDINPSMKLLLKKPMFILAVLAQFLYVAGQTGINSFFINYVIEEIPGFSLPFAKSPEQAASLVLAFGGMGLFWIGRLFGTYLLKYVKPGNLLMTYGIINVLLILVVIKGIGFGSVIALFTTYFFMSVMFPTIFALGIRDLGALTKKGSSFLVMAVAGGAFCPPLMGLIADNYSMAIGFIIPLICFGFISYFGYISKRINKNKILVL